MANSRALDDVGRSRSPRRSATAEVLSKLKKGTGSNEALLELVDEGTFIAGIKVLTNPSADADTFAWGIDSTRTKTVLRKGVEVPRFDVPGQDAIDVRPIARVGFAFLHPQANVRLYDAARSLIGWKVRA